MRAGVVGEVAESNHPDFSQGDVVQGESLLWAEYATADGDRLRRVDPSLAPVSTALGVLGMPGATAYFGLLEAGDPRPGDALVVDAAAGAVGSVVGQIGRLAGCRVVGIAGADENVDCLTDDFGFDAEIQLHGPERGRCTSRARRRGRRLLRQRPQKSKISDGLRKTLRVFRTSAARSPTRCGRS
jgi:NADPH-dependent curcumin reductase CurA